MKYPSAENGFYKGQAEIIIRSYRKLLAIDLIEAKQPVTAVAEALFYAPFAVLSHTVDADPVFNYANLKTLELFGFSWDELIGLPSRFSAEPGCQTDRDRLLKEVNQNGFIENYTGVRLAKMGARFLIKNAVVWNLSDEEGVYVGQAACLKDWEFL